MTDFSPKLFWVLVFLTILVAIEIGGLAQTDNPKVIMTPVNYEAADQVVTLLNKTAREVDLSWYEVKDGAGNVFKFSEEEGKATKLAPFGILRIHTGPEAQKDFEGDKDLF